MKSILDHSFRYTPSVETDLRKTFAKIRRRQSREKRALDQATHVNVLPIRATNDVGRMR